MHLTSIITEATCESDVLAWMAHNTVKRSELVHQHEPTLSTALMLAVRRCMLAVTSALMTAQAPVNVADRSGDTSLHWACLRCADDAGMLDTVRQLLEAGADANAVGDLGNMPLHMAATANSHLAIKLLLAHGAAANFQNKYKQTPEALCTDEECLKLFSTLRRDGDLCRQEMRDQLEDARAQAMRSAATQPLSNARTCAALSFVKHSHRPNA